MGSFGFMSEWEVCEPMQEKWKSLINKYEQCQRNKKSDGLYNLEKCTLEIFFAI